MKRRTNAEIAEVQAIHDRTDDVARAISERVDPDCDLPMSISAAAYWHNKAEYQRDVADTLVLKVTSKDPELIERVALAVKLAIVEDAVKVAVGKETTS